jgi:hypothetical protein
MEAGLIQALLGSGPLGAFLIYLILERRSDRADRKEQDKTRLDFDERRLAGDLKMTAAITALAMKITGRPNGDPS